MLTIRWNLKEEEEVQQVSASIATTGTRIAAVTIYSFYLMTSDQARLPAELKHITKQRKRN